MPASVRARMAVCRSAPIAYATANEKRPESWLMRVESLGHGMVVNEDAVDKRAGDELLLMGLRLKEGIRPRCAIICSPGVRSIRVALPPCSRKARSRRWKAAGYA